MSDSFLGVMEQGVKIAVYLQIVLITNKEISLFCKEYNFQ